jgi:hypothetical protein
MRAVCYKIVLSLGCCLERNKNRNSGWYFGVFSNGGVPMCKTSLRLGQLKDIAGDTKPCRDPRDVGVMSGHSWGALIEGRDIILLRKKTVE